MYVEIGPGMRLLWLTFLFSFESSAAEYGERRIRRTTKKKKNIIHFEIKFKDEYFLSVCEALIISENWFHGTLLYLSLALFPLLFYCINLLLYVHLPSRQDTKNALGLFLVCLFPHCEWKIALISVFCVKKIFKVTLETQFLHWRMDVSNVWNWAEFTGRSFINDALILRSLPLSDLKIVSKLLRFLQTAESLRNMSLSCFQKFCPLRFFFLKILLL